MSSAFDLRNFAPPRDVEFQLRKHPEQIFVVDADPDVDLVARMLRLENVIRGREEGDIEDAFVEGKKILLALIQERQPEITDIKVGGQEVTVLFSLILHGDTVAQAVLEAITEANALDAQQAASSAFEHDGDDEHGEREAGDGDGGPLLSEKPSSEASSSLAASVAGPLVTGTA